MSKTKRFFDKYKDYFTYSHSFSEVNIKISYVIALFAANKVHSEYKINSSILNNDELTILGNEIKAIKTNFPNIEKPSFEEFNIFIENMFANVDEEDREGEVTSKTAKSFKILVDLIEVFNFYGEIPQEWSEKKKYCKFKAVDIMTSLKKGEIPKRGGPNDKIIKKEKTDIDKEIEELQRENKKEEELEKEIRSK
jgi:hypothetical protein